MTIPKEIEKILGEVLSGKVIQHEPYGVFLDVGHNEYVGLIQIIDFVDLGVKMDVSNYPNIGSRLDAVVIGFKDPNQIALSIKPCVLHAASLFQ